MKAFHGRLVTKTLALLFLTAGAARADMIGWSYDWSRSPLSVSADGTGTGSVDLAVNPGGAITGNSTISVVNLSTSSAATNATPDTFTAKPYALTLSLTDGPSQASGQLTFAGHLDGTLTATNAAIKNTFDGPTTQTLKLGNDTFTVSIGPYTAPGAPNASLTGGISAFVTVNGAPIPVPEPPTPLPGPAESAPEPSTLVLAALAAPLWGLAVRARRNRAASRS
jgi:hypothetical protein